MKQILVIGDRMINNMSFKNKLTITTPTDRKIIDIKWSKQVCHTTTAMEMNDTRLLEYFLGKKTFDIIILCFGTIDLGLNDTTMNVLKNVTALVNTAKNNTKHVILLSSIDKYSDYNLSLFFKYGRNVCSALENLEPRHSEGVHLSRRGRKKVSRRLEKMVAVYFIEHETP